MEKLLILIIPLLAVCTAVACTVLVTSLRSARLKKFAAANALSYKWRGPLPIAVRQVIYDRRGVLETGICLHGPWNGLEVFACDLRIGTGAVRESVDRVLIVAVRAELHDISGLDIKRWKLTPLNGWTFLIPAKTNGPLKPRKVKLLWDALVAAAQPVKPNAVVTA